MKNRIARVCHRPEDEMYNSWNFKYLILQSVRTILVKFSTWVHILSLLISIEISILCFSIDCESDALNTIVCKGTMY